jgi:hypothetical protein
LNQYNIRRKVLENQTFSLHIGAEMHSNFYCEDEGLLEGISAGSPRFMETLVGEMQGFSRRFSVANDRIDERWSLIDCGIKTPDWQKFLDWAGSCPHSACPGPNSWLGGMILLLAGAAIAQGLEADEPLWQAVADVLSPPLRLTLFGFGNYPLAEARESLAETVRSLQLREQLNLPGTHRWWRTVQLQVGFSGNAAAARLSSWLAGQGIPQTIMTLLSESEENGSESFRALWNDLRRWRNHLEDVELEKRILQNSWYPAASHKRVKEGLARSRGIEIGADSEPIATMVGSIRIKDGAFEIESSTYLPPEIANSTAKTLQLHIEGKKGLYKFVRNPQTGERAIEDGPIRLTVREALEQPGREMRVIGVGGALYRERLELWTEEDEILIFDGRTGRQVYDLEHFKPRSARSYLLIARSDVELTFTGQSVGWADRSVRWCFYPFPNGFPPGLEAMIEQVAFWSPECCDLGANQLPGLSFHIREVSAARLSVLAMPPPGWTVERCKFSGHTLDSPLGEISVSPLRTYEGKKAYVTCSNSIRKLTVSVRAERAGEQITGAAYGRPDGSWQLIAQNKILDAGEVEGQTLAVRWSEIEACDPWLTLGDSPLVSYPRNVRRQRFNVAGEPLELRFGLMNEAPNRRVTFSPAVYSSGLLTQVGEEDSLFVLRLRETVEAIGEMVLWVWEANANCPRKIGNNEVVILDRQTMKVNRAAVDTPVGWAISFDGDWRGSRFHCDPHSKRWPEMLSRWSTILARQESWLECASALRAWRFPVMMEPFRKPVGAKVKIDELSTLKAWAGPNSFFGAPYPPAWADFYAHPLRSFLWKYRPGSTDAMDLWHWLRDEVIEAFGRGHISPTTSLLLYAHPILLAQFISETLWIHQQRLEREVPMVTIGSRFARLQDPSRIEQVEREFRALFSQARELIEKHTNIGDYPELLRLEVLRAEALSDLKSWTDSQPLDSAFFDQHIVKAAEAHYDGREVDTGRLEIAIARSKACSTYLASHLLKARGLEW